MKLTIILLAALAAAAPPAQNLSIKINHFYDMYVIYTGSYDIVDIAAPHINPAEKMNKNYILEHATVIFFVQADFKENGDKDFKGLYVYTNDESKKILENGQSVTYGKDVNAYFGAKDGIYKFNETDYTAVKVGNVTDSVVKMAIDTKRDYISYLTEDHVLYKFDTIKNESTKIEAVKDARDIIFDLDGNMFFYDGTKQMYVFDGDNVLKIKGLPSDAKKIIFYKISFSIKEVFAIVDGTMYKVIKDGTSEKTFVEFEALPTAFSLDYVVFQYYGYNKKIYRYGMLTTFDLMALARSQ